MTKLLTANDLHLNPFSPDRPAEWALPSELLELLDNDGKAYFSPEGRAALNRIALGEWFLIKNRPELDDVLANRRCRHCNQHHPYVSVACVPAPFHGLRQLHVMLSQQPVNGKFRAMAWDDIEVTTAANAKRLNQRIRERRGTPPVDQHGITGGDVDGGAIEHRIQLNAEHARRKGSVDALKRAYGEHDSRYLRANETLGAWYRANLQRLRQHERAALNHWQREVVAKGRM
jgi:hypothetical protein